MRLWYAAVLLLCLGVYDSLIAVLFLCTCVAAGLLSASGFLAAGVFFGSVFSLLAWCGWVFSVVWLCCFCAHYCISVLAASFCASHTISMLIKFRCFKKKMIRVNLFCIAPKLFICILFGE